MKAKLIIAMWLISLIFLASDNLLQVIISLCCFAFFSWLLKRHEVEAIKEVKKLENRIDKLIKAMNVEKDVLDIWKERIKNEAKHGDKKKACDVAGTTPPTYLSAMKREKFIDLKDGELKTLQRLIERLDARKERFEKIQSQYAG